MPDTHPDHPPHDSGGRAAGLAIDQAEHAPAHWEKEADALRMLLADARRRIFTTDESRRVQEQLDAARYWAMPYYERWILATSTLLLEKSILGQAELEAEEARLRAAGEHLVTGDPAGGHGHGHHDHEHDDDHHHDHEDHPYQEDDDAAVTELSPLRLRGVAMRNLVLAKGILTAAEIRAEIEKMDSRGPHLGARVVTRAWVDAGFAARVAQDAAAAVEELGLSAAGTRLAALFNTEAGHHLVVCTLCSCYPRAILGRPPAWYKSRAYRARAVRDPRAVLREFGTELPAGVELRVHDSNAELRYLVVPRRPAGTEGWTEERLAGLVTRDSMIGVTEARTPG